MTSFPFLLQLIVQVILHVMLALTDEQVRKLLYALLTAVVLVVVVLVMKRFGELKRQNFGVELNLLTYGFLAETVITALKGNEYWPNFNNDYLLSKGAILFIIAISNLFIMGFNFKLEEKTSTIENKWKKACNQFLVGIMGCISLTIFLALNIYWS